MFFQNLKQLFIFSFYFEIIIHFPKAIYSSHQEEQLKKKCVPRAAKSMVKVI